MTGHAWLLILGALALGLLIDLIIDAWIGSNKRLPPPDFLHDSEED
jgi:hypothetical protein